MLLIADSVLARYRDTVHAAARAATLAMENTSLQATISAQIHRVAESARLAAARDAERRSIQGAVASICAHELTPLAAGLGERWMTAEARAFLPCSMTRKNWSRVRS